MPFGKIPKSSWSSLSLLCRKIGPLLGAATPQPSAQTPLHSVQPSLPCGCRHRSAAGFHSFSGGKSGRRRADSCPSRADSTRTGGRPPGPPPYCPSPKRCGAGGRVPERAYPGPRARCAPALRRRRGPGAPHPTRQAFPSPAAGPAHCLPQLGRRHKCRLVVILQNKTANQFLALGKCTHIVLNERQNIPTHSGSPSLAPCPRKSAHHQGPPISIIVSLSYHTRSSEKMQEVLQEVYRHLQIS